LESRIAPSSRNGTFSGAINALKDKYEYPEWHFIEVENGIRDIKNQLINKTNEINL
jgi:hypothetical protein